MEQDISLPFLRISTRPPSIPALMTINNHHLALQQPKLAPGSTDDTPLFMFTSEAHNGCETSDAVHGDGLHHLSQQPSSSELHNMMSQDSALTATPSLVLPGFDTQLDRELSMFHLLKAYGEATENHSVGLARVIQSRLSSKVSPVGTATERLGHYLIQIPNTTTSDYLTTESLKNYSLAFRAFYEITPYGRFAHFVANAAILDSLPSDAGSIRIVDLDVGEGVQWPPLLAALGPLRSVQLTCIHLKGIERNKERLTGFAHSLGLDLKVDETGTKELVSNVGATSGRDQWLVFNCMVGLPHMGMTGSRREVVKEFMSAAEELIARFGGRGMLVLGNGHGVEMRAYSDGHLLHSHALFRSMEWHFPLQFSLARTAMECLFVGPSVSSSVCGLEGNWEEGCGSGLERCRVGRQNLMEAKEMVGGIGGGQYGVKVGGCGENEMVLEWRGTALVRVSSWRGRRD